MKRASETLTDGLNKVQTFEKVAIVQKYLEQRGVYLPASLCYLCGKYELCCKCHLLVTEVELNLLTVFARSETHSIHQDSAHREVPWRGWAAVSR